MMKRLVGCSLVLVFANDNFAVAQNLPASATVTGATPAGDLVKPRVFITDSNSWSTQGSAGGANGVFAANSSGGARPQTAEIIKTFGQRCPQVTVNNRPDISNYIVQLDHEGGKGLFAHKDKIAVFVQKSGDSIFSKSTMSVGGSVQDACAAVLAHWAAHASELKPAAPSGYGQGGIGAGGYGGSAPGAAPATQESSLTVDATVPNCDIEVDGNFVGNTPSTLVVASGKHSIAVKKKGYADWTRSMMVAPGSVRLSAEMETSK